MRRKLVSIAAAASLVGGTMIGSATPAHAYTVGCISVTNWTTHTWSAPQIKSWGKMTNNCSGYQKVRMNWAYATDGACKGMYPGQSWSEYRGGYPPYVRSAYTC